MEFGQTPRRRKNIKLTGDRHADRYPHGLQFYTVPPVENISLQDFEDLAVDRLKVLKVVETVGIKHVRGTEDYDDAIKKDIRKLNLMKGILHTTKVNAAIEDQNFNERREDHISHFILRLAYCKSEDLRRWFIQQEMDLFRWRFLQENKDSIQEFLQQNKLNYSPIPEKEKLELLLELADSSYGMSTALVEATEFFKVPFTEALDLVKSRKVYLSAGFAYVPRGELVSIILSVFRTHLSHALAVTSRSLPHLEEDDRLLPLLNGLSKRYLGQDYSNKKPTAGQITADMIDTLSKKSFPLCMQQLHQSLRKDHHLKHGGRQQYGLFLKGIGLSLDEALKFWRTEFTKMMDVDKFDKQYSYNIRHNYGKEGKRADYTPYSCMKIIMSNAPSAGDNHGCPFRHSDSDLLKQRLQAMKVSKDGVDEVTNMVKSGHYQVACMKVFELSHNSTMESMGGLQHPNQYFEESQKVLNGVKTEGSQPSLQRTPKVIRVKESSQKTPSSQYRSQSQNTVSQESGIEEFEDDFPTAAELDAALKAAE